MKMHAAGFVHGDVWASNALHKGEDENDLMKVMLIDFDGAGRNGQAHCGPLPFNATIPRAPGVAPPGGVATPQHDSLKTENEGRFFI